MFQPAWLAGCQDEMDNTIKYPFYIRYGNYLKTNRATSSDMSGRKKEEENYAIQDMSSQKEPVISSHKNKCPSFRILHNFRGWKRSVQRRSDMRLEKIQENVQFADP